MARSAGQSTEDSPHTLSAHYLPSQSGQERRSRAWARLTAAAAHGDHSAWRHLVTVHAQALWHFALDCGLTPTQASDACELAWLRAAQSLEERPHIGQGFAHALRGTVVEQAHQTHAPLGYQDPRPHLDLVGASSARRSALSRNELSASELSGSAMSEREQSSSEQRLGSDRRQQPRRRADEPSPPYFQAFDRIAAALEGIEQALAQRVPIVLPDAGTLQESHPRP